MKLLRQIIKKKYTKYLENVSNKRNDYWDFFQIYNLLCVMNSNFLPTQERKIMINNWRNAVSGVNLEISLGRIQEFVEQNVYMITNFLRETDMLDQKETRFTGLYEKGRNIIGVATYEFENILGQ